MQPRERAKSLRRYRIRKKWSIQAIITTVGFISNQAQGLLPKLEAQNLLDIPVIGVVCKRAGYLVVERDLDRVIII
jgi:hypothetical protein